MNEEELERRIGAIARAHAQLDAALRQVLHLLQTAGRERVIGLHGRESSAVNKRWATASLLDKIDKLGRTHFDVADLLAISRTTNEDRNRAIHDIWDEAGTYDLLSAEPPRWRSWRLADGLNGYVREQTGDASEEWFAQTLERLNSCTTRWRSAAEQIGMPRH